MHTFVYFICSLFYIFFRWGCTFLLQINHLKQNHTTVSTSNRIYLLNYWQNDYDIWSKSFIHLLKFAGQMNQYVCICACILDNWYFFFLCYDQDIFDRFMEIVHLMWVMCLFEILFHVHWLSLMCQVDWNYARQSVKNIQFSWNTHRICVSIRFFLILHNRTMHTYTQNPPLKKTYKPSLA